jgi:subtilisin family serine protease
MIRFKAVVFTGLVVATVAGLTLFGPAPAAVAAPGPADAPEWWFDTWNVPSLWTHGADGRGVVIAEIDSGVNASLPQLTGRVIAGTDFGPSGGDGRTDHEIDPFGHGTAMASLMVATIGPFGIEGLAPSARVLPIAIPLAGTDDAGGDDHLADAIRYAADHGAKIINMSIGEAHNPTSNPLPCDPDEQLAVTYAVSKGAILLAAGGNSGLDNSPVEDPGVCIGVVSVGAVDSSGKIAGFSSRHRYAGLVAPGVNIPTLGRFAGTAYHGEGTSQATAIASAAVALVWSKFPDLTNRQILARVFATLDNPHPARDPAYGFGQINPYRAINDAVPDNATEPVISALAPFMAVQSAQAADPLKAPSPVAVATAPPGHYASGTVPGRVTPKVIVGAAVAVLALFALLVLLVLSRTTEPVQGADDAAQRSLHDRLADPDPPEHTISDLDL